jgi:ABC-type glycerol-3-phosphate transport system substrate-binding protein
MKRLTLAILILAMLASIFAACGGGDNGSTATTPVTDGVTDAATTTAPETNADEKDFTLELP